MRKRHLLFAILALGLMPLLPAAAQDQPVLQIEGGTTPQLDLDAIKQLGPVTFETSTPWTDGEVTFEALPGDRLLDAIGGEGTTLSATANDGYTIDIPIDDFKTGKAYLAVGMNGQPLTPDDFGPFWIVYDYDSDAVKGVDAYVNRSIWQLKSLKLR
jgi:hypothetical protein